MISFSTGLTYSPATRYEFDGFNTLMFMLLGSIAYVAAGSFRRERETGALELILVTPLSEQHIILGRLRGLWGQFLPTFLLWVAVTLYLSTALHDWQVLNLLRFAVLYLAVPVVGLYFSLRLRFVLLAWIATLTACFALPQLLWWIIYASLRLILGLADWNGLFSSSLPSSLIVILPAQAGVALLLLWRLRVNLVGRTFSLR